MSERLFSYKDHDFYDEHHNHRSDDLGSDNRGDDEEEDENDFMEFSTDQDTFFFADRLTSNKNIADASSNAADGTLFGAEEGSVAWDAPLTLWTLPEIGSSLISLHSFILTHRFV